MTTFTISEELFQGSVTAITPVIPVKSSFNIIFSRDGKQIGVLDFNGPSMTFEGDAEDSACVFFDWLAQAFTRRLDSERLAEREACAQIADKHE